ncbi:heterokaryon incompatibility protein-domain-containing protein [Hyaloscypha finlandica]|nr:heterokaryon incompatibility protein-domain-containing protein [Hyaloscypha finlandica]
MTKAKGHIALLAAGPFLARRISDTIDMNRVRGWLSNCAEWHGDSCNKPLFEELGSPSDLRPFRVIDVQEGRLTTLPIGARYLALSYCWGAVQSLVTVRANVHQLERLHGIFDASQELANTIKDAIALTSKLEERYLWVDQLCIIQDEIEIKMELINKMDKIYGHAHLVIIAESGSDANTGLPGFGDRPRSIIQATAEIEPGLEVALLPYPVDMIHGCWYSSRGWTYQEQALAKRLLMFVGGQVISKCHCALWREDRQGDEEDSLSRQDNDFSNLT